MIRAITFIPASSGTEGLTYIERASRNRSLHVLLQDCSTRRASREAPLITDKVVSNSTDHSSRATRSLFLRGAYREIISRFVSFGLIEHPLPLVRSIVKFLEQLSKAVDSRVDDFRGIGFYILLQDGETFYLLASREGRVRLKTTGGFVSLGTREIPGVTELPVETSRAQKELFSDDLRDFVALYRIDTKNLDAQDGELNVTFGGSGNEMDTMIEALQQPGVVEKGVAEKTIPLNQITHKMLYVRFDGLVRTRDLYVSTSVSTHPPGTQRRLFQVVAVIALVSLGAVWLSARLSQHEAERGVHLQETEAVQPLPNGTVGGEGDVTADVASLQAVTGEDEQAVRFSLLWQKTYNQPVTSSPLVAGNRVVFGGRDGYLYALTEDEGSVLWRYKASDGIGASPKMVGGRVIAADYAGNVFAVGANDGQRIWNRKLPAKVVSTPCVGDGEVLVGCYNGTAYALSVETGRVLWRLATGARIRGSAAYADGRFFVPSYSGMLYAVTGGTGGVKWETRLEGRISSSPAVAESLLVIGGPKGSIYGLDADTGKIRWKYGAQGPVDSFVLQNGGRVFVGSNDKHLYCLDAKSGDLLWKYKTGGVVLGRAVVSGDLVVFPSYDGKIYCVNAATGEFVDRYETSGAVFSSPALGTDKAYFGNNKGKFYCVSLRGEDAS